MGICRQCINSNSVNTDDLVQWLYQLKIFPSLMVLREGGKWKLFVSDWEQITLMEFKKKKCYCDQQESTKKKKKREWEQGGGWVGGGWIDPFTQGTLQQTEVHQKQIVWPASTSTITDCIQAALTLMPAVCNRLTLFPDRNIVGLTGYFSCLKNPRLGVSERKGETEKCAMVENWSLPVTVTDKNKS